MTKKELLKKLEHCEPLDASAINDLIALYGGGSLGRQMKSGIKRSVVKVAALFAVLAFIILILLAPLLIDLFH